MNTKSSILTGLLSLLITFNGISQEILEKNYFDSEKKLGGDITLKSSAIKVEGCKTYKIFEFESPDNGNYYLNIWLMGGELESFGSGKFTEYDLSVNNEKQVEKLRSEKNNWHNVGYKDDKSKEKKSVKLKKGLNQIVFSCDAPEIPTIEFIKLTKEKYKSEISENTYNQFVADIKTKVQDRVKNPQQNIDSLGYTLKSGVILSNPKGNYDHHIGINFRYTTYKTFSFNSGQQVFFSTYAPDGYYHVLEVFSYNNPESYTWSALSNSSGMASINVKIPSSGSYFVRVRAYQQETQGLVNLNVNGQYYYSDCPVSGSGFAHPHETPTTYDYFTCKLTGDSRLWIEDDNSFPGKIRAWNDDYYTNDEYDFSWGVASRIKKDFSVRIKSVLVSAYSSYSPTGTCDLYIKVNPLSTETYYTGIWPFRKKHTRTPILDAFPNLKANDAMQTAWDNKDDYNCISWSGGITNYWEWH